MKAANNMNGGKNWNQSKHQVESIIMAGNGALRIISGEGETGTAENYDGTQTNKAIFSKLQKERCRGERWAYVDTLEGHALLCQ